MLRVEKEDGTASFRECLVRSSDSDSKYIIKIKLFITNLFVRLKLDFEKEQFVLSGFRRNRSIKSGLGIR